MAGDMATPERTLKAAGYHKAKSAPAESPGGAVARTTTTGRYDVSAKSWAQCGWAQCTWAQRGWAQCTWAQCTWQQGSCAQQRRAETLSAANIHGSAGYAPCNTRGILKPRIGNVNPTPRSAGPARPVPRSGISESFGHRALTLYRRNLGAR